jgi:1-acyl-sn-glycerol-3-phosphate acyltransferase
MSRPRHPKDTLVSKFLAGVLWLVGLCWMIPMMTTMMVLGFVFGPDRTDWFSRIYTRVQVFLTGCKYKVIVHPDISDNGVYLFAQNHTNILDHVILYHATPHFKQGLELESHFRIPVYGWFMKSRGTIPVRPGRRRQTKAIMNHMLSEIAKKHSILAFPEAHRTLDGSVHRFHRGVFHIARDLSLPVVPVAITGWYETKRKGSWIIRPGYRVTVHCLQPIPTAGLSNEEVDAIAIRAQKAVSGVIEEYWHSPPAMVAPHGQQGAE